MIYQSEVCIDALFVFFYRKKSCISRISQFFISCKLHTMDAYILQVFNGSGSETTTTTRAADSTSRSLGDTAEDIHVDIDGLDDGQLASSWDNDHSNTTSPADSTSTNNSTSSLAKRNGSKSKKKSSKSSKSSSSSHGSLLD